MNIEAQLTAINLCTYTGYSQTPGCIRLKLKKRWRYNVLANRVIYYVYLYTVLIQMPGIREIT